MKIRLARAVALFDHPRLRGVLDAAARRALRDFLWRVILCGHLVAAAGWWWLMPGGFPVASPRFWANRLFPPALAAVCALCLWGERRGSARLRAATAATLPAFWLAATATAVVLFPISARRFLIPLLPGLAVLLAVFVVVFRRDVSWRRSVIGAALAAAATGAGMAFSQRAPRPCTSPAGGALPHMDPTEEVFPGTRGSPDEVRVLPDGVVTIPLRAHGGRSYRLSVDPLLTFRSRSPDRCWTIFAPARHRTYPERALVALRRTGDETLARFRDDGERTLRVVSGGSGAPTLIEAASRIDRQVYSHLNTFAMLTLSGCRKPELSFSPCPEVREAVESFDYPVGRPIRAAYVDRDDRFHVVRARSGEKGPFTELGAGHLGKDGSLGVTVWDEGVPVVRVWLDDWAAQAGRDLSPTAGWGFPVNAIEFARMGDEAHSPVTIWCTLAGTSVGRGWDSVGHSAGTYRNRIRVEAVPEE